MIFYNQARVHHPFALPHPLHSHYVTAFNPVSRGSDDAVVWAEAGGGDTGAHVPRAHHKHTHFTMDFFLTQILQILLRTT